MDDRTGRPEQIMAPALRSIIKRIDLAIENGSLDPKDRDEVIKMFISGPTTVVDNKAGGGMMTMENMTMPIGYQEGGPVPRSRQQSVMEEEIMQQAMQNKAEPQGGILSGLMSLINKGKDAFNPYVMDAMDIVLLGREEGMNIEQAQGIVDQSQDEERTIDRNSDQFKKLQVLKEQALKQMRRDAGIR